MTQKTPRHLPKKKRFLHPNDLYPNNRIILGETLSTKRLVIGELWSFLQYAENFSDQTPEDIFGDWAEATWWYPDSPSDCGAVWQAYILKDLGTEEVQREIEELLEQVRSPVPEKTQVIGDYPIEELKRRKGKEKEGKKYDENQFIRPKPGVSMEQLDRLYDELQELYREDESDPSIRGNQEKNKQWIKAVRDVKERIADLQIGKKLCANTTCVKYIPSFRRSNAKYCSPECASSERKRRFSQKNPKSKMRSDLKYLEFLKKEGDL